MFKKFFVSILSVVLLFTFSFSSLTDAQGPEDLENQLKELDLSTVLNLDEALSKYSLTKSDIKSAYSLENSQGVINLYDSSKDIYINLYVNNDLVEYQSIQRKLENGNAVFELYTYNLEKVFSEEITPEGHLVSNDKKMVRTAKASKPNKAALKWACIFSSYLACISVAAAAGAAGSLVSGPFGAAAGFAGGYACRYVFQTLVEKYGSKDQACKMF